MSWLRIDDDFRDHPKTVDLSDAALMLWLEAATWCSKHPRSAGFVPRKLLRSIAPRSLRVASGVASEADPEATPEAKLEALTWELVEATAGGMYAVGLWEVCENGWQFHDWEVYQPEADSEAPPKRTPKQQSEAGRLGGKRSAEARAKRFGTAQPGRFEADPEARRSRPEAPLEAPDPDPDPDPDPEMGEPPPPEAPEPSRSRPLALDFTLHPRAVSELSRWSGFAEPVIHAAVEEFKSYWILGGGRNRPCTNWQAKCRDDIRHKHETGKLAAIASRIGPAMNNPPVVSADDILRMTGN